MLFTMQGRHSFSSFFFFFNDTATTEIYTLSLHDALPISIAGLHLIEQPHILDGDYGLIGESAHQVDLFVSERLRSEEHTSELQSHLNLVCRLLLEKKKIPNPPSHPIPPAPVHIPPAPTSP